MQTEAFLSQESGTTCFVVAVYNFLVHKGLKPFDFETGVDVAAARNGAAIFTQELIEWSAAPLVEASNYRDVLQWGGILSIMHPICNGHTLFVFPDGRWSVTMVNSWLGPNVYRGIGWSEIEPFIAERQNLHIGSNWVDSEAFHDTVRGYTSMRAAGRFMDETRQGRRTSEDESGSGNGAGGTGCGRTFKS